MFNLKSLGAILTILSLLLHLPRCIFLCLTVHSAGLIPRLSLSLSILACPLLATQSILALMEVKASTTAILLATVSVLVSIQGVLYSPPQEQKVSGGV